MASLNIHSTNADLQHVSSLLILFYFCSCIYSFYFSTQNKYLKKKIITRNTGAPLQRRRVTFLTIYLFTYAIPLQYLRDTYTKRKQYLSNT